MDKIKVYEMADDYFHQEIDPVEDRRDDDDPHDGMWVKYADHVAAVADKTVERELERSREMTELALRLDAQRLDFAEMLAEKVAENERMREALELLVGWWDTIAAAEAMSRIEDIVAAARAALAEGGA